MVKVIEMLSGQEPKDWKPNTKQLYTAATSSGWTRAGVHDLILFHFKRGSTKDLTWNEYWQVLEWLDKLPPNSVSVRDKETIDMFEPATSSPDAT